IQNKDGTPRKVSRDHGVQTLVIYTIAVGPMPSTGEEDLAESFRCNCEAQSDPWVMGRKRRGQLRLFSIPAPYFGVSLEREVRSTFLFP
ncbi:hypothetical protein BS47DRAFT_1349330, partial [Hydnum rufescens UP504]